MVTTLPDSAFRSMRWRLPSKASSSPSWISRSRARRSPTPASVEHVDSALLQQAGADAGAQIFGRAPLEHDALDAGEPEQPRQQQPRRPAADNSNLCAHAAFIEQRRAMRKVPHCRDAESGRRAQ